MQMSLSASAVPFNHSDWLAGKGQTQRLTVNAHDPFHVQPLGSNSDLATPAGFERPQGSCGVREGAPEQTQG